MLIGLDTRNTGRSAGTGVATYATALKKACAVGGHHTMMIHDASSSNSHTHSFSSRITRAARSVSASRTLNNQSEGYTATDLYRTAEIRDRLWKAPTLVKASSPPDIMHWTYPLPMFWSGIPNVVTIHDVIPVLHPELSGIPHGRILRRLQDWCERATAIVTVSNAVKADLITAFNVPETKIFMSSQAVCFSESLLQEASKIAAPCEPDGFLYFGTLERRKNIGRIIEAHSRSRTKRPLTLIGTKGSHFDVELRALENHRQPEMVNIINWCPQPALIKAIQEARAVVFPSLAEGFGLPIIEAMALQTPVITSKGHATEEIAGSAAFLINNQDTDELAYAMNAIGQDDALHSNFQKLGSKRVTKFTFDAYARRMSLFYQYLVL